MRRTPRVLHVVPALFGDNGVYGGAEPEETASAADEPDETETESESESPASN